LALSFNWPRACDHVQGGDSFPIRNFQPVTLGSFVTVLCRIEEVSDSTLSRLPGKRSGMSNRCSRTCADMWRIAMRQGAPQQSDSGTRTAASGCGACSICCERCLKCLRLRRPNRPAPVAADGLLRKRVRTPLCRFWGSYAGSSGSSLGAKAGARRLWARPPWRGWGGGVVESGSELKLFFQQQCFVVGDLARGSSE